MKRRDVIKSIGTGAGVAMTGISVSKASAKEVNEFKRTDIFEQIRAEVEDIRTSDENRFIIKDTEVIKADTQYGTLMYITHEGESEAILHLSGGSEMPTKYSSLPANTEPTLFAMEDKVVVRRLGTDFEHEWILNFIHKNIESIKKEYSQELDSIQQDDVAVIAGTDIDGYEVDINLTGTTSDTDEQEKGIRLHVNADEAGFNEPVRDSTTSKRLSHTVQPSEIEVEWIPSPPSLPSIPDGAKECAPECVSCIQSIGSCYACALPCAGSPTGIGAVKCAVCIHIACTLGGTFACTMCKGCLLDWVF